MPSQAEIVSQIMQALQVTVPDLDTSIGTPVRKILDAVSESIGEAYIDQYFLAYQYDVDSLSGSALDDFVQLFGITRVPARRATGVVTFARPTPASTPQLLMAGTAIATTNSPAIVFTTLITAVLPINGVSIDVPIIASVGGSIGNVAPNAISLFQTPISGFSTLANTSATANGSDTESDDALRSRFKSTVFRNFAGTEPMFLGVAQENPATVQANVLGSAKTHREQIQVINHVAQSTVQNVKYVYPYNFVVGQNIDSGVILNPNVHYSFNSTTNPLASPSAGNVTPSLLASAGTFASGVTRYYRIAWANQAGTTPATAETSVTTTVVNQGIVLTFSGVPLSASWIYIYEGATSGSEALLAIVPASQATWTDGGYLTTTTAYPTTNTTGFAPTITALDYVNMPDGVYDLQFDYVPVASRNDPVNGITNKIDIYVQGDAEQQANETVAFSTSTVFNQAAGDPLNFTNYLRADSTRPRVGNYFLDLTFAPVSLLASTITIAAQSGVPVSQQTTTVGNTIYAGDSGQGADVGSVIYNLGVDYFLVNDTSSQGESIHSRSGIEWMSVANGGRGLPPIGSLLQVLYNYNALPRQIETNLQRWRLVTTDVWVHAAQEMLLNVNLVAILGVGYTASAVLPALTAAMEATIANVGFDGVLSTSEILTAAGQVNGVSAVRFATSTDAVNGGTTSYAIQQVSGTNSILQTFSFGGRATDVYFDDRTVPNLNHLNLTIRAQNSYATGA